MSLESLPLGPFRRKGSSMTEDSPERLGPFSSFLRRLLLYFPSSPPFFPAQV